MLAGWAKFTALRFAAAMLTMAGAVLLLFVLIQFVPGDLITIMLGPRVTPELREAFAQRMGLDQPLLERLWLFFSKAAVGDFGTDGPYRRYGFALIWWLAMAPLASTSKRH